MADPVAVTNTFANGPGNTADATQVNQNFADLVGYLNNRMGNLSNGQLLVANASGQVVGRSISGDIVIDNAGVASIQPNAVGNPELADNAVGPDELTDALAAQIGAGMTARGKSIIATEESRANAAYGTLTTPDQVPGIVLPTDGLIVVAYSALWKSSAVNAGDAAIFLGSNQLKVPGGTNLQDQETNSGDNANSYTHLVSSGFGLGSLDSGSSAAHVTTGQVVGLGLDTGQATGFGDFAGGPTYIWASAGTYTISVRFKASSGSVTAKERKLWVWTMGF